MRIATIAPAAPAFDASQRDSFRKEIYPDYKANREPAPEQLKYQFALCRDFCRAVGISQFSSERFEADDIIGSLAQRYRQQGHPITVVSADKDLTQLVLGDSDQWWDFARGTVLNAQGVKKHFGVLPGQIADMLGEQGIVVARRTVAKYRESLRIAPVAQRKSL
jgi:5'-3' exonuclease